MGEAMVLDEEEDQPIIVTTSANLTKSGWCSNLEAAHLLEVPGH